eukprot:761415-Hanusia_phi.AAC.3
MGRNGWGRVQLQHFVREYTTEIGEFNRMERQGKWRISSKEVGCDYIIVMKAQSDEANDFVAI